MTGDRRVWHKSWPEPARRALFGVFLALILAASRVYARDGVDLVGRRVNLPEVPQRVVTLAPSLTEMVFALGAGPRVVGVSRYSNYPEATRDLPRVGSYVQPDVEKIVALNPDLCLVVKDGNPREVVDKLEQVGIPVYAVNPKNLDQVMETLIALGEVLQARDAAKALVADMKRRLHAVDERVRRVPQRPGVFFQIGVSPIVSVGTETFAHELITRAGGRNLAEGPEPYPRFTVEEVMALRPDIIVISSMERDQTFERVRQQWLRWPNIPAVALNRVVLVASDLFDRSGPRLVEGLERLVTILHPELD
ncbi:ABC transporter substrate-binding protein [Desulfosoma caldarium]|uniref:Iron complex transport system substrate-binding protein n=1 Tax=Desulfosoma caldarium TaxID=610254 RepID=A0A3N1UPX6_9BACT|nr:cobalamin-binding protein [Desulfosoma caldarium]ROQ93184.1 iron complex transport system substrate-binding protein [Desulfosoma caldarium]